MINFIVVDDESYYAKTVASIITNIMMKNTAEYKIHMFNDYDDKFMEVSNSSIPNKIYVLDIQAKSASGLDIARKIRRDDLTSVIIFMTAHEELGGTVAKTQLMVLTFICKFDNLEENIEKSIIRSLEYIGKNSVLRFNEYSTVYTIPIRDILYITHDSIERKCLIKTDYTTYKVNKTLLELKECGNGELIQSHRSCLINKNRIIKRDLKKGLIVLDNNETIDLVSLSYKKELV